MRGFFEVGIIHGKTVANVGTLWRSAMQLGASGIFTIGRRYQPQCSDTMKAFRHIPLRHFETFDDFYTNIPYGAQIVAVEFGGTPLRNFSHPASAIYLLGAEDFGIKTDILKRCHHIVSLEADNHPSYNQAVAGSVVLYHRRFLS